jgi:hypothetical protein
MKKTIRTIILATLFLPTASYAALTHDQVRRLGSHLAEALQC